ncbi:hypothetical protein EXIGLDRAFT_728711 [Exidia glandulosa HHB12029]|uniref:Uncharacterized protein n=1 Tax=Exidia glandulosa HHB12029 TaxID=1314781 RepID=A0A165LS30_EXIGL|nr:hypothetical protein EXIGLDRAFT_728711 [Exidia glandulosa HHB12029]
MSCKLKLLVQVVYCIQPHSRALNDDHISHASNQRAIHVWSGGYEPFPRAAPHARARYKCTGRSPHNYATGACVLRP